MSDYFYRMWAVFLDRFEGQWVNGERMIINLGYKKCFDIAWEMVLSDKNYSEEYADPKGNESYRGLKAIWDEIKTEYLYCEDDAPYQTVTDSGYITDALRAQEKDDD